MTCELITRINDIEAAYLDLRDRCAPSATLPPSEHCVVPMVQALVALARAAADNPENYITETVSQPEEPHCLSEDYLWNVRLWIEGMTCEEPYVPCPSQWAWVFTEENGASWTQVNLNFVRITFEDSLECGGSNPYIQSGSAEACFVATERELRIVAHGIVETQNAGFEAITVSIDDVVVYSGASVTEGGLCVMETLDAERIVALVPGRAYRIRIDASTRDPYYHQGALWEVTFFEQ